MGNLCSKRKGSDSISAKSEGSNKKGSSEHVENHSQRRPNHQNDGKNQAAGAERSSGTEVTPSTIAAETPELSLQAKESIRSRIIREAEPSSVSGDSMSLSSPTMMNLGHTPDLPLPSHLPMEIKKQPENIRNLLIGRIGKVKPIAKSQKITIYICAADSQDFRLEKGHLHTEVYPELREYCSAHGFELHITDLHWKTELETKQDHDFPELCLGELKRQQEVAPVIPLLFLSNSLGSPLLPKTMEQQDFEMALSTVSEQSGKELLGKWYKLDTHAQPQCYRLTSISEHIPNIQSCNLSEKSAAMSQWQGTVDEILETLLRVFPNELRDTYLTTVIEQEIHNSIFMSRDVGKRSIWTNRSFTGKVPASPDMMTPAEVEKNRRLESLHNELKNQLVSDRILTFSVQWKEGGISGTDFEHRKYLLDVSSQLSIHLKSAINEIMEEESTKGKLKSCYGITGSLTSEVMQHTVFSQQGAKCCLSFDNLMNDIKLFLSSESSNHPLVVHGPRGCGKTCFLSRVIQQASSWYPDTVLVYRFVGLTSESRSLVQLLQSVTSQVAFLLTGRNYWIPHNANCYLRELYRMVSTSTTVLIVIDGLDGLTTNDVSALDILAEQLPSKIKLILSCADDTPVFQLIKSRIQQPKAFVQMPSLSLLSAESVLTASILQYSHSIDSEVQKRLSARLNNSVLPVYIKVLAWQTAIDTQGLINISQVTSVESAINSLFDYLERVLEAEKVALALGYLCASRNGLCDSQLLDILAHTSNFSSKITFMEWAPVTIFLAQLFRLLGPFLEWRLLGDAWVMQWRDSLLCDLAKARYIKNAEVGRNLRQTLLSYFKGEWKDAKDGRFIEFNSPWNFRRSADEIPFLECHLKGSIKSTYLCNLEWLQKKIQSLSVFSVLEDMWLESSQDQDLTLFRHSLELSACALSYEPKQFYGQMYDRLLPYFGGSEAEAWSSKCPFTKKVFDSAKSPGMPCFVPLSTLLHSPKDYDTLTAPTAPKSFSDLDNGEVFFNDMYRMKSSNQFVVSLSTAKEEVIVWDVYSEATVRTLKGVHNPVSLKVIDEHRCVILCGRELITYNIDNGTQMTKLKGVMNQKMPFYGLHDENHIVAISRNRMYVNLMNIDSGDCITTFKVGEDRFLNSLLVSENGKFLVCGDETQKPFPLLVWDLPSRKLLYDLRIPHHEFVTSLAAITKEGNFVCCVCREVDDPGPNFIVVYDLQSGTLFKKWKPGCSTQAIAISQQGGCVINGLEDNRIIVWDLVTGTSQWSLEKHIAPPDILKLDNRGSRCISCDSQGRDRSVCLWDVTTGHLLAIYTPDSPFTACEVFNNGDGVVLGLKGRSEIATLTFQDAGGDGRVTEKYGSQEHHGKVTVLK